MTDSEKIEAPDGTEENEQSVKHLWEESKKIFALAVYVVVGLLLSKGLLWLFEKITGHHIPIWMETTFLCGEIATVVIWGFCVTVTHWTTIGRMTIYPICHNVRVATKTILGEKTETGSSELKPMYIPPRTKRKRAQK